VRLGKGAGIPWMRTGCPSASGDGLANAGADAGRRHEGKVTLMECFKLGVERDKMWLRGHTGTWAGERGAPLGTDVTSANWEID